MTNALKLAEEIEGRLRSADCHPTLLPEDARLVAAALRLAEIDIEGDEMCRDAKQIADYGERRRTARDAYRAARAGRP